MLEQADGVERKRVQRDRIGFGRYFREAKSSNVGADYAEMPRQERNPSIPAIRKATEAVRQDDGRRVVPRIGKIVEPVAEHRAARSAKILDAHGFSPSG